ncbi:DUF6382 domain-containing protein [Paenibacillus tyrfis]|uniref:FHA domain-containing protein n=1 Tax=Paenibacillus tyrfis TaxID=1501230 RepID=A0A081P105_9BACL|nr:DUF6382 domain-containing protein [Paenibacillus tyrfis]KEQ24378.1 hypothetical protein ET33_08820 [Paenibacillus tyrfis]
MDQQLYGLKVDFDNRNGHFMVLSSPAGMRQQDLSSFQVNMLSANRIPRLLEVQVEARNGDVCLYYAITGKRMLSHWLRMEKLSLAQYYSLLLHIVEVLDDSKVYMLQPGRYILKEEYIYCGAGFQDLYLTYIPKEHLEGKGSVSSDIQQLASRLIHRVTELQGSGFQELMRYLQEEAFNLPELKQLLLKQIGLLQHVSPVGPEPAGMTASPQHAFRASVHPESMLFHSPEQPFSDTPRAVRNEYSVYEPIGGQIPVSSPSQHSTEPGMYRTEAAPKAKSESRRKQLFVILLTVLAWCFIWKIYFDDPSDTMLWMCIGLTLIFTAGALVLFLRIAKTSTEAPKQGTPVLSFETNNEKLPEPDRGDQASFMSRVGLASPSPISFATLGDTVMPNTGYPKEQPDPISSPVTGYSQLSLGETQPYETHPQSLDLAMRTTLLAPQDATVFLGKVPRPSDRSCACLEVFRNGVRERIQLHKNSFVIGRAGAGADWVHEEAGVSRLHAEFVKDDEGYAVKDLGSRNGTTVNGESLVPYRVHQLKEGDIVKIVSTEFTFKMGF